MPVSFYLARIRMKTGQEIRGGEEFLHGSLEVVKRWFENDLSNPMGALMAICYRQWLVIEIWQRGRYAGYVDMYKHISFNIPTFGSIFFENAHDGWQVKNVASHQMPHLEKFLRDFDQPIEVTVDVSEVPPLEGDPAGIDTPIRQFYEIVKREVKFGSNRVG